MKDLQMGVIHTYLAAFKSDRAFGKIQNGLRDVIKDPFRRKPPP